jgi:transposase
VVGNPTVGVSRENPKKRPTPVGVRHDLSACGGVNNDRVTPGLGSQLTQALLRPRSSPALARDLPDGHQSSCTGLTDIHHVPSKGRKDVPSWSRWRGRKPRPRRAFTDKFKADIVERCLNGGRSVGRVAKDFDLTGTAARAWVRGTQTPYMGGVAHGTKIGSSQPEVGLLSRHLVVLVTGEPHGVHQPAQLVLGQAEFRCPLGHYAPY